MSTLQALIAFSILWLTPALQAVKITTSDDREFEYTRAIDIAALRQNTTIDNFFNDIEHLINDLENVDDARMPLPEVSSSYWQKIMACCQLLHAAQTLEGDDKQAKYQELQDLLASYSHDILYTFINNVNFLNNTELLDHALDVWVTYHLDDVFQTGDIHYTFNEHITKLIQDKVTKNLNEWFITEKNKKVTHTQRFKQPAHEKADAICYSPDGTHLISSSLDNKVYVWDPNTGVLLDTLSVPGVRINAPKVNGVCYSPDGQHIAFLPKDSSGVYIWNATTKALLRTLPNPTGEWLGAICYSPYGNHLAISSTYIYIYDIHTGSLVKTWPGHDMIINSICYSPDGKHIASASHDETVRIWDAHTGALLHTLGRHIRWVMSVCYSPDGKYIASASMDDAIRIWDAHIGALLRILWGHTRGVRAVCYSPDGKTMASASEDHTVRIWNAATGELLHTLPMNSGALVSVRYSPKGDYIAAAARDGSIGIWDPMYIMKHTCSNDQRLLLYAGFKQKHQNKKLVLNKPHMLKALLDYDEATQRYVRSMLPLEISAQSPLGVSVQRSLLQRMYAHNNRIMFAAGLGVLGYLAWHHYKK